MSKTKVTVTLTQLEAWQVFHALAHRADLMSTRGDDKAATNRAGDKVQRGLIRATHVDEMRDLDRRRKSYERFKGGEG